MLARSIPRHMRVASKQELKERLIAAVDHFNEDPVVHTWTYQRLRRPDPDAEQKPRQ
jgi:hypothetical protein